MIGNSKSKSNPEKTIEIETGVPYLSPVTIPIALPRENGPTRFDAPVFIMILLL
jgi:hypothetical protein